MFEHMKNYHLLLKGVSKVLRPGGKLFVHIFATGPLIEVAEIVEHEGLLM